MYYDFDIQVALMHESTCNLNATSDGTFGRIFRQLYMHVYIWIFVKIWVTIVILVESDWNFGSMSHELWFICVDWTINIFITSAIFTISWPTWILCHYYTKCLKRPGFTWISTKKKIVYRVESKTFHLSQSAWCVRK